MYYLLKKLHFVPNENYVMSIVYIVRSIFDPSDSCFGQNNTYSLGEGDRSILQIHNGTDFCIVEAGGDGNRY